MSAWLMPVLAVTAALLLLIAFLVQMRPADAGRMLLNIALSLGAHVAIALFLLIVPAFQSLDEPTPVSIEVVDIAPADEPPPPPAAEEPPPEPVVEEPPPEAPAVQPPDPPPPEPEPRPRPRPQQAEPEPPPPDPTPPPPQEETVADFTGTTLTNPGGESWQTNVGNGAPMEGPVGRPNAAVTGRNRSGVRDGAPGGTGTPDAPRVAAASDLSRQPGPPNDRLIQLLERNYPREAQQLGVEGHADVRIHVHADGRVRPMAVLRETHEGFGEACRRTLRQGGSWTPPLDRAGSPVDTVTTFRCTFSIRF
jgi:protein TonB